MAEIELQGLDELLNKLSKMSDNVNKYQNQALHKGADIVEQSQKDIVDREAYDTGKLKEGLKKGNISTRKGVKAISIGIQKDDNSEIFYGKFINWGRTLSTKKGTKTYPGIHFMERSIEENKDKVLNAMKNTIKEAIDNAKS